MTPSKRFCEHGNWHKFLSTWALSVLILTGCANDPHQRTKIGAAIGAAAGAAAGYAVDDGAKGALIGAAVGALAGGAVGNYMDRQQQEFERVLAEEQARHEIEIERLKDDVLKLDLSRVPIMALELIQCVFALAFEM